MSTPHKSDPLKDVHLFNLLGPILFLMLAPFSLEVYRNFRIEATERGSVLINTAGHILLKMDTGPVATIKFRFNETNEAATGPALPALEFSLVRHSQPSASRHTVVRTSCAQGEKHPNMGRPYRQ